jgi:signal transduction histidine kinase
MSTKDKINILAVDDNPAKLLTYEAILRELDEDLILVTSAEEALRELLKTDVAIMLLDVHMPEIDGFELAAMIREHPRFHRMSIIFISAVHQDDLDRLKGYERGAVDYIAVPVVPELLRAKVSVFAELQRQARQMDRLNIEQRRLSNQLVVAHEDERRHVARELHDGLGQEIVAIKILLTRIVNEPSGPLKDKLASEGRDAADRAMRQVRSLSHLLHPPQLQQGGLVSSVRWYLDGLTKRAGITTSLDVQPPDFCGLAPDVETAIFRIIQEALTNVFRHAAAATAWVTLRFQEGKVVVTIKDDGTGVEQQVTELDPACIGIGLGGMRVRAKELGGELRVSNANPGTLVEVVLPVIESTPTKRRA